MPRRAEVERKQSWARSYFEGHRHPVVIFSHPEEILAAFQVHNAHGDGADILGPVAIILNFDRFVTHELTRRWHNTRPIPSDCNADLTNGSLAHPKSAREPIRRLEPDGTA